MTEPADFDADPRPLDEDEVPPAWRRLVDEPAGRALAAAAAGIDPGDVAAVARLRRHHDAALVAAALDLAEARRRAVGRLAGGAALLGDPNGVQQATDAATASAKARRLKAAVATLGGGLVIDACCGIGADAAAFVREGLTVVAIDRDPLRAWMAARNARCPALVGDVRRARVEGALVHVDPSRRDEARGMRRFDPAAWSPTLAEAISLVLRAAGGVVKMGPGIDHDALDAALAAADPAGRVPREVEIVARGRDLVAAHLWLGATARETDPRAIRRATDLERGLELAGSPDEGPAAPIGDGRLAGRLLVPHPAIERARLTGAALAADAVAGAIEPARGLGLLVVADPRGGDGARWFDAYDIVAETPLRVRAIRAALDALGAGEAVVRTRGNAADADALAAALRRGRAPRPGAATAMVFALRVGDRRTAVITRTLATASRTC